MIVREGDFVMCRTGEAGIMYVMGVYKNGCVLDPRIYTEKLEEKHGALTGGKAMTLIAFPGLPEMLPVENDWRMWTISSGDKALIDLYRKVTQPTTTPVQGNHGSGRA